MRFLLIALSSAAATCAFAQYPSVSINDERIAVATCMTFVDHTMVNPHNAAPNFLPGHEECPGLISHYQADKAAADAADETKNPALKQERDVARKLGALPQ